jgi:uncharacterized iron-regulated membrane protein
MNCIVRAVIIAITVLTPGRARAEEAAAPTAPPHPEAAAPQHACLDQKERKAAEESGKVINLPAAMRAARKRAPGTLVQARLCRGKDGLVYVLTVLAGDGKVARLTVDAVKGTVVGER